MDFWADFGRFADVVGIVTVLLSAFTAYRLWIQNRKLRELAQMTLPIQDFVQRVKANQGVQTIAPVALAVSLLEPDNSIKPLVSNYLKAAGLKMEVEEVILDGVHGIANLEKFVNLLCAKRRYFDTLGCTELHLFFAGPVQAAVVLGAMFDN